MKTGQARGTALILCSLGAYRQVTLPARGSSKDRTRSDQCAGETATACGSSRAKTKDWTGKPPVIVEAMRVLPVKSATFDGEGETICALGAERIVAKRRDRPYRSGRSPDWVKIKNSDPPAAGMRSHRKWRVVGCCAWWWREGRLRQRYPFYLLANLSYQIKAQTRIFSGAEP